MKRSLIFFSGIFIVLLEFLNGAIAEVPLKVTTTLSSYADIAKSIGKELVDVRYIASPKFNPHLIEPRPSDVLKVKKADLFIHSGLDLEVWRSALVDAAGRADIRQAGARQLDLSSGISLLEIPTRALTRAAGDIHLYGNPHFWMDPRNGRTIANKIALKLSEIDPAHTAEYQQNLSVFLSNIDAKIAEWSNKLSKFRGQELIAYHNEWVYLMNFSGLTTRHFLEPKPGIPPTPQQIEFIINHIKQHNVRAIIQATFNPKEAASSIAKLTQAKVLTLCQNVGETSACSDYLTMMDYNIREIIKALGNG